MTIGSLRRCLATVVVLATIFLLRPVQAADVVEIPVVLSLTGSAAFLGRGIQQSLHALEDLVNRTGGINGGPVSFVVQDDQSNPAVAVQLMNGLIAKNAPVVLGSLTVGACQAIAALIKDGPVQYCLSPGVHPEEGSYEFSALTSTTDAIDISLRYFRDQNIKRIAVITATDATGQVADRSIDASIAALKGDVTIVDREHFNTTDISVAAQLAKVKAANPQLLVAWITGGPVATVFRAAKEAALDVPVLTTYGNSVYSLIAQQWASFLPATLYLPAQPYLAPQQVTDRPTRAALDAHYAQLAKFSMQPDIINGGAWDAAMLVVDALRKLGPHATAAQVRDFLANTRGWAGICGRYDFKASPQRGINRNAMFMARWDATKQVWVAVSRAAGAPLK
jgi:branched-chain amino acid transport system substrate-binding protein